MKRGACLLLAACALLLVACSGPSGDASSTSSISPTSSIDATSDPTDTLPSTYDPYAGTLSAIEPVGQVQTGSITTPDGRVRTYRLYVPASAGSDGRLPLLIALHGGLGWGAQFATNSGFDGLAEANRFIVVYPDGTNNRPGDTKLLTWNGGLCCRPAADQQVDDVGFLRALIDRLEAEQPVDPNRVLAAGHSNGAILAYRLACELSNQILAIGVQSGVIGVPCQPSQPVSVFHLHGLADSNIPIEGGRGSGPSAVEFPSPREAASGFAALDDCQSGPIEQSDASNADVLSRLWSQCAGGSEVRFVTVTGASHAWMGHPTSAQNLVGPPYMALDASRAIWSFLAGVATR